MAKEIDKIIDILVRFPGIGPRQARRIGFYLANLPKEKLSELSSAALGLSQLTRCTRCFGINGSSKDGVCQICSDSSRDQGMVAIVEKETDLTTLENTKRFKGRYLVLGPLSRDGILTTTHKERLKTLSDLDEIIIALSPTAYGDVNGAAVAIEIKSRAKKITRLGRGMPTGAEVEFADEETLGGALENRK